MVEVYVVMTHESSQMTHLGRLLATRQCKDSIIYPTEGLSFVNSHAFSNTLCVKSIDLCDGGQLSMLPNQMFDIFRIKGVRPEGVEPLFF